MKMFIYFTNSFPSLRDIPRLIWQERREMKEQVFITRKTLYGEKHNFMCPMKKLKQLMGVTCDKTMTKLPKAESTNSRTPDCTVRCRMLAYKYIQQKWDCCPGWTALHENTKIQNEFIRGSLDVASITEQKIRGYGHVKRTIMLGWDLRTYKLK